MDSECVVVANKMDCPVVNSAQLCLFSTKLVLQAEQSGGVVIAVHHEHECVLTGECATVVQLHLQGKLQESAKLAEIFLSPSQIPIALVVGERTDESILVCRVNW